MKRIQLTLLAASLYVLPGCVVATSDASAVSDDQQMLLQGEDVSPWHASVLRARSATVNVDLIDAGRRSPTGMPMSAIQLELFDDVTVDVEITEVRRGDSGLVWVGRVAGDDDSEVLLAPTEQDQLLGVIRTDGQQFELMPHYGKQQIIERNVELAFYTLGDSVEVLAALRRAYFRIHLEPAQEVAEMSSPAEGGMLPGTEVEFTWGDVDAVQHQLWIGSAQGKADYFNGITVVNNLTVKNLPSSGDVVYARLWSLGVDSEWRFNDYTYTSFHEGVAQMSSPSNGEELPGSNVQFTWAQADATQYELWIGAFPGDDAFFNGFTMMNSLTVPSLPMDGQPLHARLWSLGMDGKWRHADYTYASQSGQ